MAEIKAGNIRKGTYILFKNDPCLVTKTDFMSPGKGSAFMRVKLKNIRTSTTQEFTYKSTENVEMAEISSQQMQFLYLDADEAVFMDARSYEQAGVPRELLEGRDLLLTPDVSVYVITYADRPIGVSFPAKVKLKVTQADDAVAGNTVGQARKNVTLETGLVVQAPLFVKEGDTLLIDSETKTYASRG
jgi:elongation factor P